MHVTFLSSVGFSSEAMRSEAIRQDPTRKGSVVNVNPTNTRPQSDTPEIRKYKKRFNSEILCAALWGKKNPLLTCLLQCWDADLPVGPTVFEKISLKTAVSLNLFSVCSLHCKSWLFLLCFYNMLLLLQYKVSLQYIFFKWKSSDFIQLAGMTFSALSNPH